MMSGNQPPKRARGAERLEKEHLIRFNCSPGISCFTRCCRDVTVALTPYDVLRLKNRLGVRSGEFLEKHTLIIPKKGRLLPLVLLKMNEEDKRCPFVSESGCFVYEDRPWPCRMYPLDLNEDGTYQFIADGFRCRGLNETNQWQILDWLREQGTGRYDEINQLFTSFTLQLQAHQLDIDNPQVAKMTFMALYNLDTFREFVFKSSFLDRFQLEQAVVERINTDDEALLQFAFDWLNFGLFGQKLFWVKPETCPSEHEA